MIRILKPLTLALLIAPMMAMAIEEPEYQIVDQNEEFELRLYSPYIIAEVDVPGDMSEAGNRAFRILAGYIFGDNAKAEKMAMTAPVEASVTVDGEKMAMTAPVTATAADGEDRMTYGFVMESKYTLETLPVPNDDQIRIRTVPERMVAVRRYSGRWTESKYQQHEQSLRSALQENSIETVGPSILARYNSPMSLPFMRRNEVMIEVALSDK